MNSKLDRPTVLVVFFSFLATVDSQYTVDQETYPSNQYLAKCISNGDDLSTRSRVCRDFENDDPEAFMCDPNYLRRPTLFLSTSPWKSSIYATWVAQIIISERLHYPVLISGNVGGNHDFYGKKSKTTMNKIKYN